jgi:hypothetical protein
VSVRITIRGLDTATAQVQAAVRTGVSNGLAVAGARGEFLVKQNITHPYSGRPPAVSTGILANAISFKIAREVGISRVVVFAMPPADVYVDPVEYGSRPHFPPVSALLMWVERKFHPGTEKAALKIAWAIAVSMSKRGMKPFLMFARAFAVLQTELQGIFTNSIASAIQAAGLAKK